MLLNFNGKVELHIIFLSELSGGRLTWEDDDAPFLNRTLWILCSGVLQHRRNRSAGKHSCDGTLVLHSAPRVILLWATPVQSSHVLVKLAQTVLHVVWVQIETCAQLDQSAKVQYRGPEQWFTYCSFWIGPD